MYFTTSITIMLNFNINLNVVHTGQYIIHTQVILCTYTCTVPIDLSLAVLESLSATRSNNL